MSKKGLNSSDFRVVGGISIQISPTAVVCNESTIKGEVTIGAKTVVHPQAQILASGGPIILGDSNIIEECAIIENLSKEPLIIGNNNVFEIRCHVQAGQVGDHNVFETKCWVGQGMVIGTGCSFGAGTRVSMESCPDYSVFFGQPLKHRIASEKPPIQTNQIEFLTKVLPNYHHIRRVKEKPQTTGN